VLTGVVTLAADEINGAHRNQTDACGERRMKAYLIGFFQITDPKKYHADYVAPALGLIAKHGGKPLIVADECMTKEGRLPDGRFVVIEFPDMQSAEAFYSDPDYLPLKPVRQALTQSTLAFVQGIDLPR
jgi:uncharacterized protein (DUF1330 family)